MGKVLWIPGNHPRNAVTGKVGIFELLADDGWPEDAGSWPLGGGSSTHNRCSFAEAVWHFSTEFLKDLFRAPNRIETWLVPRRRLR